VRTPITAAWQVGEKLSFSSAIFPNQARYNPSPLPADSSKPDYLSTITPLMSTVPCPSIMPYFEYTYGRVEPLTSDQRSHSVA
jgi:hypothetical protein